MKSISALGACRKAIYPELVRSVTIRRNTPDALASGDWMATSQSQASADPAATPSSTSENLCESACPSAVADTIVPWQELATGMLARRWMILLPLAAVLPAPLLLRHRQVVVWPALIFLVAVCVLLAAVDLRHRRLPSGVVLWSYPMLSGLLLIPALVHHEVSAWGRAAVAAVLVGVVMHLIPDGVIGHGDAKLLGLLIMMPAWFGWSAILPALFVFFVPVAAESVVLLATARAERGDQIAFGPPLIVGAYLYFLLVGKGW